MKVSLSRALLAIPFLVVALGALGARRAVPRWGARIGKGASAFVSSLVPPRGLLRSLHPAREEPEWLGSDVLEDASDGGDARAAVAPLEAHVPADEVQWAIDDQGTRIHARSVRDRHGNAAGIRLTGVAALGPDTGLRDGDVIVSVDGEPTMTEEVAIDRALDAVVHGRSTLRAVAMRRGRAVAITADLPATPSGKAR